MICKIAMFLHLLISAILLFFKWMFASLFMLHIVELLTQVMQGQQFPNSE